MNALNQTLILMAYIQIYSDERSESMSLRNVLPGWGGGGGDPFPLMLFNTFFFGLPEIQQFESYFYHIRCPSL